MSGLTERRGHHVITLGTAGGPRFWRNSARTGIATAIVVDDGFYLVDCGHGVGRQMEKAGLEMSRLKGIFLTHLHSDHTVDLNTLALFGLFELQDRIGRPVPIIGPGNRGALPPVSPLASVEPDPMAPHSPTPGTAEMFLRLMEAAATDLNDRIIDALRPSPMAIFDAQDIDIPDALQFHPNENPVPATEGFEIYRDESVVVTATLVEHPPVAPAFAFRFDTAEGSVCVSGDTTYTPNMVRLSRDAGLVLHEAIDFDFMESMYRDKHDETSRASLAHHYKSHTSVVDAVRVAREAGARRLALHHLVPGSGAIAWERVAAAGYSGEFLVPDDLAVIPFDT
ncbi:MBL fold metallo-hydrolase [Nesterenkonia xinjiangensis]|uniref:Ribonuclease BN (tRNA processing enzyme) n=1 Tax=Nesterenkonia xinjiangensis TaxID=225327 RepID=A0A7Z0GMJ0_9MICC|nr:ribonuclease BN (tRNA processing enzyme) [Nesterenkonia xinjiangensis]